MRLFLLLLTYVIGASAAELPASEEIKRIEGVYKHRFKNGSYNHGKPDTPYESENIIEIVRYDEEHVYVRASLQFYNGHVCGLSGMARYEDGAFIYRDPEKPQNAAPSCTLKVARIGDALTLTDRTTPDGKATCRDYCGMRGSLSNYSIPMNTRRPIRYMQRLTQSPQYLKALDHLKTPDAAAPQ